MNPMISPKNGIFELNTQGQVIKLMKNSLNIRTNALAPCEKPLIGDLNICFLKVSRLVWKLLSFVSIAKNLKIPFTTEKPNDNMNKIKVINP